MSHFRIDPEQYQNIVFLTGAGISVAAGLPTFRGAGGLWNNADLARLSDGQTLRSHPEEVWQFYRSRLLHAASVEPTKAHSTLARLEARLGPEQRLTIITMNVDGLHSMAGSRRVVEFHGSVRRVRCLNEDCGLLPFEDSGLSPQVLPRCPHCGSPLRPDVVLFNEMIPPRVSSAALKALVGCDLFVTIGSSGTVHPANQFVSLASRVGARTVCINVEPEAEWETVYRDYLVGPAEEIVPRLFAEGIDAKYRLSEPELFDDPLGMP